MAVLATLNTVAITLPEQQTAAAQLASGTGFGGVAFPDAGGIVSGALNEITRIKAELTALNSVMPAAVTVTFANSSATISGTGLQFVIGQGVQFTGTVPTNFATATTYYVVSASPTAITVAATVGGSAIVAGSAGTSPWTARGANAINLAAIIAALA